MALAWNGAQCLGSELTKRSSTIGYEADAGNWTYELLLVDFPAQASQTLLNGA